MTRAAVAAARRYAATVIDIRADTEALDAAKERAAAAIRRDTMRALRAWRDHGEPPAVRLTPALAQVIVDLYRYGRRQARTEIQRVTGAPPPARRMASVSPDPEDWPERLTPIGQRILSELAAFSRRIIGDLAGEPWFDLDALPRTVARIPGPGGIAAGAVSAPYTSGLAETYEANEDLFGGWQYTAVLDGGTCEVCAPLDGTTFQTLEEALAVLPDFGPNPDCLGGWRCRCRLVPVP